MAKKNRTSANAMKEPYERYNFEFNSDMVVKEGEKTRPLMTEVEFRNFCKKRKKSQL